MPGWSGDHLSCSCEVEAVPLKITQMQPLTLTWHWHLEAITEMNGKYRLVSHVCVIHVNLLPFLISLWFMGKSLTSSRCIVLSPGGKSGCCKCLWHFRVLGKDMECCIDMAQDMAFVALHSCPLWHWPSTSQYITATWCIARCWLSNRTWHWGGFFLIVLVWYLFLAHSPVFPLSNFLGFGKSFWMRVSQINCVSVCSNSLLKLQYNFYTEWDSLSKGLMFFFMVAQLIQVLYVFCFIL